MSSPVIRRSDPGEEPLHAAGSPSIASTETDDEEAFAAGAAHLAVAKSRDTNSADDLAPFGLLTTTDLGEGMLIAGRYAIRSPLGSGGMGRVFLAEHIGVGRMVAVKILDRQRSNLPAIVRRFQEEARAANVVEHPAIASVFDCGALDDGRLFMAMEYVRGTVLSDVIRSESPLPWRRAANLTLEIADGVAAVHRAGLIHRDLKPSNLMVIAQGEGEGIKILDFGIAANLATPPPSDGRITRPGQLVGTPLYMAPEQTQGAPATPAMDVYAIAVILYEMIRGELPHYDVDPFDLVARKRRQEAPLLSEVPEALRDLVAEALSIDPARRPPDAGALAERLRAILRPRTAAAAPSRRRGAWIPLVAAAVLLGSLGALSLGRSHADPAALEVRADGESSDDATFAGLTAAGEPRAPTIPQEDGGPVSAPPEAIPAARTTAVEAASATTGAEAGASLPLDSEGDAVAGAAKGRPRPTTSPTVGRKARCDLARSATDEARKAHEWETVLRHSREAACWPNPEVRRSIRVKAALELGDHEACRREGAGARDPSTLKMVDFCTRRLEAG